MYIFKIAKLIFYTLLILFNCINIHIELDSIKWQTNLDKQFCTAIFDFWIILDFT